MMMTLISLAEKHNIIIDDYDLGDELLGIYLKIQGVPSPIIFLHKKLLTFSALARCVLAEELGHYFTMACGNAVEYKHKNYGKQLQVNKIEKAAIKWGGKFLIPDEDLYITLKHGQLSLYEVAQKFNVTEAFAKMRLQIFKEEEYALRHGTLHQRLKTTAYLAGSFNTF